MSGHPDSSGDLLADRRFGYAQDLRAEGDPLGAADLLEQTMARVPAWAAGWMALAGAREQAGDPAGARAAYAIAVEHDAGGRLGAALNLARLSAEKPPETMPPAYVAALFDAYAPRFAAHLVGALHYRGPAVILDALDHAGVNGPFTHALDLGCGTGLMGAALGGRATRLDGIDLSPAMVEQARRTGFYADVAVSDAATALAQAAPGSLDLVLAADVLAYIGDLRPLVAGVASALRSGGAFAFTAQSTDEAYPMRLGADLRYAHAPSYLVACLQEAGLLSLSLAPASIRQENGQAVPGLVGVARTP